MPRRRAIRAVLHNFLETYTSRYADHGGYWVFGQFVEELDRVEVDLLADTVGGSDSVTAIAVDLAVAKFASQLQKCGFGRSYIREARLTMTRLPGMVRGQVNGQLCWGYWVCFAVRTVSDLGKSYECEKRLFVAPHDARIEWQSCRGQD